MMICIEVDNIYHSLCESCLNFVHLLLYKAINNSHRTKFALNTLLRKCERARCDANGIYIVRYISDFSYLSVCMPGYWWNREEAFMSYRRLEVKKLSNILIHKVEGLVQHIAHVVQNVGITFVK